jgi:hypothetical protein
MSKLTNHLIFRSYLALYRAENFTPSELGETIDGAPTVQMNWLQDEDTPDGVIRKPSNLTNRLICAELKRKFGIFILRRLEGFDKNGDLILPKQNGYLVPKKEGNLIVDLEFKTELAETRKERQMAA